MKKILFLGVFIAVSVSGASWDKLLKDYKDIMGEETYNFINNQYEVYISGKAPAIARPEVKNIKIIDCGENLVDIKSSNNSRIGVLEGDLLIRAHKYQKDIDTRSEKYSYVRKGVYDALCRMTKELDILAPSFGYNKNDLEIKLFEGLRDIETQKKLFDETLAGICKKNPELKEQEAYEEACKWVSPYINNVPVHSTGAAVDIVLYNIRTGKFCDMGRFNRGGRTAPIFSNDPKITQEQQKNRLLFLIAATRAGLTNYLNEFWHFSYGDKYAAFWREQDPERRVARYGAASFK